MHDVQMCPSNVLTEALLALEADVNGLLLQTDSTSLWSCTCFDITAPPLPISSKSRKES